VGGPGGNVPARGGPKAYKPVWPSGRPSASPRGSSQDMRRARSRGRGRSVELGQRCTRRAFMAMATHTALRSWVKSWD
jgi:hypothetical protein